MLCLFLHLIWFYIVNLFRRLKMPESCRPTTAGKANYTFEDQQRKKIIPFILSFYPGLSFTFNFPSIHQHIFI